MFTGPISKLPNLICQNLFTHARRCEHRSEDVLSHQQHRWSSGRILPCHGRDPGSIPGRCMYFLRLRYLWVQGTQDILSKEMTHFRLFPYMGEAAFLYLIIVDKFLPGSRESEVQMSNGTVLTRVRSIGKKPCAYRTEI